MHISAQPLQKVIFENSASGEQSAEMGASAPRVQEEPIPLRQPRTILGETPTQRGNQAKAHDQRNQGGGGTLYPQSKGSCLEEWGPVSVQSQAVAQHDLVIFFGLKYKV